VFVLPPTGVANPKEVYVDDFNSCQLVPAADAHKEPPAMTYGLHICDFVGLRIDPAKTDHGPIVTITGVVVDAKRAQFSQPAQKRRELLDFIQSWLDTPNRTHSLRDWHQLTGYLNWSASIYPFIAPALAPLYATIARLSSKTCSGWCGHTVDDQSREALGWIAHYIEVSPPTRLLDFYAWRPGQEDMTIYTDASLTGLGCFFAQWSLGIFHRNPHPYGHSRDNPNHIGVNEMFAIFLALSFLRRHTQVRPLRILVYCDNSGVVSNFNSFHSKCPATVRILRDLVPLEASEGLSIRVYGIRTTHNVVADRLSRDPVGLRADVATIDVLEIPDFELPRLTGRFANLFPHAPS
jgi:hypothetical protein